MLPWGIEVGVGLLNPRWCHRAGGVGPTSIQGWLRTCPGRCLSVYV